MRQGTAVGTFIYGIQLRCTLRHKSFARPTPPSWCRFDKLETSAPFFDTFVCFLYLFEILVAMGHESVDNVCKLIVELVRCIVVLPHLAPLTMYCTILRRFSIMLDGK